MEFPVANLVTDTTFDAEVLAATGPVLVDFWAEWCGPCKAMDPILEDLSRELVGKVKIVKLNVEENVDIVTRYNVRAMPTMMVFQNGEPVDARVGSGQSRVQLTKWLDQFAA
jgi:thioredoxin 1